MIQDNGSSSSSRFILTLLLLLCAASLGRSQPALLIQKVRGRRISVSTNSSYQDTPQVLYLFPRTYDQEIFPKVETVVETPHSSLRRKKRNPGCMKKCLRMRVLHPAQCHYLC